MTKNLLPSCCLPLLLLACTPPWEQSDCVQPGHPALAVQEANGACNTSSDCPSGTACLATYAMPLAAANTCSTDCTGGVTCGANQACAGETLCSVLPVAGESWQVGGGRDRGVCVWGG